MKKRIYVAGKLNAMACDYIKNVHNMMNWAESVRLRGFAVFVPGVDFLMGVHHGTWDYNDYFDNSQSWLAASDGLFVCPGWEDSKGTAREIALADKLLIPVFYSLDSLENHVFSERL